MLKPIGKLQKEGWWAAHHYLIWHWTEVEANYARNLKLEAGLGVEEVRKRPFYTTYKSNQTQDNSNSDVWLTHPGPTHRPCPWSLHRVLSSISSSEEGRWRSWLSHLSNKCTQKVLSSSLSRLIFSSSNDRCIYSSYLQLALLRFPSFA